MTMEPQFKKELDKAQQAGRTEVFDKKHNDVDPKTGQPPQLGDMSRAEQFAAQGMEDPARKPGQGFQSMGEGPMGRLRTSDTKRWGRTEE
ncbi:MAG: hypothetical protein KC609_06145 [Myxococcales bacterium]|nr:hypothetical protein [Myxococcales bacterium]